MTTTAPQLAIVVPAFKGEFLTDTLKSVAAQTCQDFRLYVGDDASPEPVRKLIEPFRGVAFPLVYHRFDKNLGGTSLVRHWERCIALTSENWIWLFSDDDMMEERCVESFYREVKGASTSPEVFRFNTAIIDGSGEERELNPPHPREEDCLSFLYFFLKGLRAPVMQEHIFSRTAFERVGRIPEFPLAWCSDQAVALALGARHGFLTLTDPGARVLFRQSGQNISSIRRRRSVSSDKARAALGFSRWVLEYIDSQPPGDGPLSRHNLKQLAREWLLVHLKALHSYLGPNELKAVAKELRCLWGESMLVSWIHALEINASNVGVQARARLRSSAA